MALDLTGIHNVGEFYSHHYLEAVLGSDLKDVLESWSQREKESGQAAPNKRLARLAAGKQVMVVTHAPQVAARAAHHWIVKKEGAQDIKTTVTALATGQPRREEIARMLAGAVVTEEARAAAEKLLEAKVA